VRAKGGPVVGIVGWRLNPGKLPNEGGAFPGAGEGIVIEGSCCRMKQWHHIHIKAIELKRDL
jgi:hypothetical protein